MRKPTDDDIKAFRDAVDGARPIKHEPRIPPKRRKPAPKAHFRRRAEVEVLEDSLLLTPEDLEVEAADELSFRRNGIQDTVMRNLRRGYYRVEDALDLHGMTQREAKSELRDFLARATAQHLRCLRIVHGKGLGSGPRGPVLKNVANSVLRRDDSVLAFCSARRSDGGTGAIYVLLRGR